MMTIERTLSIITPDAMAKNIIGKIMTRFEEAGFKVAAAKMLHLTRAQAEGFYAVHKERPFFFNWQRWLALTVLVLGGLLLLIYFR